MTPLERARERMRELREAPDSTPGIAEDRKAQAVALLVEQRRADEAAEALENDPLIGWVQMRQLELDHIETQLIDNRPEGVRLLSEFVARVSEKFLEAKAS